MTEPPHGWLLLRQDDNGNVFEMGRFATRDEAEKLAAMYEARGHKQLYWVQAAERGR